MRDARKAVGFGVLAACALAACGPVHAGQTAVPASPAVISASSEDSDVAVEVKPAEAQPQSCRLPCTIRALPGPARVVVLQASHRDERSVELLPGPQRMRVRPRDPTLQTLGWIAIGVAIVGIGVGIYASTYFKTDGQPASPSEPARSTPEWAKVALTTLILGVVPVTLGGVYMLDRGSASVEIDSALAPRSARPMLGWKWAF